ncbi:MAG: prephenate dehydratase [Candidatus Magnetoovum sp. WYHC-5]|nr:prephenate dehydratase [Candidatus Magnetoovum sp. WYHC-5]
MKQVNDLKALRDKIDDIDNSILELLNKRAEVALQVGELKKGESLQFYNPEREKQILDRLTGLNKGKFPNDTLRFIFQEIFYASLSLEQSITVSYLGPPSTYTHLAALRYFSSSAKLIPARTIRDVFETVEAKKAEYGVVPIENSNEGAVNYTLDVFGEFTLNVYAELMIEINHNLLSKVKERAEVKKIYSHPQAIAQCRKWLETYMFGVPIIDTVSTADAATKAADEEGAGAIGSELAARLYDLNFVERNIENTKDNVTRFLVISTKPHERTGKDRTLIMFALADEPGALHKILTPFKKANINLTKIESRPSRKKAWDYVFFVVIEGHIDDRKVRRAIDGVKKHSTKMQILGSYPAMDTIEK